MEASALADHLERDPATVIVDVCGAGELKDPLRHMAGASKLSVGDLPNCLIEINALNDKPVILVCRTDKRTTKAAALLRDSGFHDVQMLRCGMERWYEKGLPVERRTALGRAWRSAVWLPAHGSHRMPAPPPAARRRWNAAQ
jgi:rhodanese-related sulfurtransferase